MGRRWRRGGGLPTDFLRGVDRTEVAWVMQAEMLMGVGRNEHAFKRRKRGDAQRCGLDWRACGV